MIGRRASTKREVKPSVIVLGDSSGFKKCKCGKWLITETGKHLTSVSAAEFFKDNSVCPDEALKGESDE